MAVFKEKVTIKKVWEVLKTSGKRWNDADPFRQAAIISFYAILSLPALMVVIISIAGYFFGDEAVSGNLSNEISEMIGADAAVMIEDLVANASQAESSTIGIIIGVGVIIFGATTVFFQLQKSLNRIWGLIPKPGGALKKYLVDRLFSFGLILVIGFLLLISLVLSALMAILSEWLQTFLPSYLFVLINILNYLISLGVIATLFAMMFKMLPDAKIEWRTVWVGGFLTAFLFEIGKFGLSIYFGTAEPESVYGAAGSIILILIWISYVSMILFYGAEFTRTWAVEFGHGVRPKDNAILIEDHYANPYMME
ncbi:MAG TPA: YihY/virulence factor BrkB family protein [Anditalea sp.]|nr:YihY/virulence factor BrkB family protein [Anditalea sp.]